MITVSNREQGRRFYQTKMIAKTKLDIMDGRTALGIEFGSTRIKSVLIGSDLVPIAAGSFEWKMP